jgi:hypothetical protein
MQDHPQDATWTRENRSNFSLTGGGPFYRVLVHLRLRTPTSMARCWWIGLLAWVPFMVGEGVRVALGMRVDPSLFDVSLHVRLLFTLPVLLFGERLLDQTVKSAVTSLYHGNFCDHALLDRIMARAAHMRDSWRVELVLLVIAMGGGQLVLWQLFGATGLVHGAATAGFWSFPRIWYSCVALPLVQFVMFRFLWRWAIWSYILLRVSRLQLYLVSTHADSAAGLSALARPTSGFSGFVFAIAGIVASAWGTQILRGRTTIQAQIPLLVTFLIVALVIAVGPLLLFSGHLFRARRRTLAEYGDFMRAYTMRFHHKWIQLATEDPLGTSDIQSLNDLGQAYQVASKSRVFVFSVRSVVVVWFSGLAPMIPLVFSLITVEEILKRIFSIVIGGLPL